MTRRVLVTDALDLVGPACMRHFLNLGDDVYPELDRIRSRFDVERLAASTSPFDVVIANRAWPASTDHPTELFDAVVQPLFWMLDSFVASMAANGGGTMVVPITAPPGPGRDMILAAQRSMVASVGASSAALGLRINAVEIDGNPANHDDVAQHVSWLASPMASSITGQIVLAETPT